MRDDWSTHLRPSDARSPAAPRDTDGRLLYVIVGFCGFFTVLFLACLGGMYFKWVRPADVAVEPAQAAAEKQAELRQAFSAADPGLPKHELSALESLFDQVVKASSDEDDFQFQRLFDRDRLFRAMQASGKMPRSFHFIEELSRQMVLGSVWIPWHVSQYRIAHVRPLPGSDEAVVYGFFWTADEDVAEMRWWVVRRGGQWKIYDWELLQFGLRCSHELALYQRDDVAPYTQLFEELGEANTAFNESSADAARRRMRRAEELIPSVPEPLREEARLWTAWYWTYGGRFDEALRVAKTVAAPQEHPGVEYIRMLYHDDRRDDEALLECADRYEAALGPGPNSARFRSAALFRLGRLPEAARACQQFLRWNTDNAELLERFALAADDEQLAELPALLTACSDPTESAVTLASSLDRYGDRRALGVLAKAVSPREGRQFGLPMQDRTAPADDAQWLANGAKVAWVWGLHHESLGDDVTASELYLRAARSESDPDERNWYLYRYLDVMQRLGRVVEAYRAVPEELAAESFAYLANGYEEEVSPLTPDVLAALLEAHEAHSAGDPWCWLHRGNLAVPADYDEAARCYREGLTRAAAHTDDDGDHEAVWALESRLLAARVRLGRWREAWEQQRDEEGGFESLANQLRWEERWDDLDQLVALRRETQPDDPWCDYFAAAIAVERGEFSAAETLLAQGLSRLGAEEADYRRHQFQSLRVEARIAAGDSESAFDEPSLRADALGQLAQLYLARGETDAVLRLAERARAESPPLGGGWVWGCRALWERRDYAALIELAENVPAGVRTALYPYEASQLRSLLFRAQLRTDQLDRALQTAQQAHEQDDEARWLLVAHALAGNSDEFHKLYQRSEDYRYNSVYADEDAGPLLRDAGHKPWREASPPWLPLLRDTGWVALLAAPRPLADDDVAQCAASVFGADARVEPLLRDEASVSWKIHTPGAIYGLVTGAGPYADPADQEDPNGLDESTREALRKHRGWLYTGVLHHGAEDATDEGLRHSRKLLVAALGESPVAVYSTEHRRIVPSGEELTRLLGDAALPDDWETAGSLTWLAHSPTATAIGRGALLQERMARLFRPVGLDIWRGAAVECRVWLSLSGSHFGEELEVRVERCRPQEYGGLDLVGRLAKDSRLVPWLTAGEPLRFTEQDVVNWTATRDGQTQNAREEAERWWEQTRNSPPSGPSAVNDLNQETATDNADPPRN